MATFIRRMIISATTVFLVLPITLRAQQIYTFNFDQKLLNLQTARDGSTRIDYPGGDWIRQPGAPRLPAIAVHLPVPAGRTPKSVEVLSYQSKMLEGAYYLPPVQKAYPLSDRYPQITPPDTSIYQSDTPFPKQIAELHGSGNMAGFQSTAVILYPLRYRPQSRQLEFFSQIQIAVHFEPEKNAPRRPAPSEYTRKLVGEAFRTLSTSDGEMRRITLPHQELTTLPAGEHRYLIITSNLLKSAFEPLAEWKYQKGLSAKIITTEWINSNYPGRDLQEKIRNFLIDAYQQWGTAWVLLGGDTQIIPDRKAFAFDCEYGPYEHNYIPCDLYYADLDGNWDANGNNLFGEVADQVDMYPDLYVGRAPVETIAEATAFVNKTLTYERTLPTGHEQSLLFLAEVLWNTPFTNSGESKDLIDSLFVPETFPPVQKLYEVLGNENPSTAITALNSGPNLVNHNGHASYTAMGVGSGYLNRGDMDGLSNAPYFSTLFSIGCWPAAIDEDCIAEHFLSNPNGGGVAFIGNSRYGWGSPGNPLYGYSDRFDQKFYQLLFQDQCYRVGKALALAKAAFVPFSRQENVYRWCEYEINLLGDPELPIWTSAVDTLEILCAPSLPAGENHCTISVLKNTVPQAEALVCISQDSSVYASGFTGVDGQIELNFIAPNPSRDLLLTVSAPNALPVQRQIPLVSQTPFPATASYQTNGSVDGLIQPGQEIVIDICLKNYGQMPAEGLTLALHSPDNEIILSDSTEQITAILPGDSVWVYQAFRFTAGNDLQDRQTRLLHLEIVDHLQQRWEENLAVTAARPVAEYLSYAINDSLYGDGDGFAEPGETVHLAFIIRNSGLAEARDLVAHLNCSVPEITLPETTFSLDDVFPGQECLLLAELAIDPACPTPLFPPITFHLESGGQTLLDQDCPVSVGVFGLTDNVEGPDSLWTHNGANDLWHQSFNRAHSGSRSWYSGMEAQQTYDNNMDCQLVSQPFIIADEAQLSFWAWYEFPNYGVDGFYVQVNDGGDWRTLDFIGSGGALGMLNTGNDWMEYRYDLSAYPPGSTLQIRFLMVSDDQNTAEGPYVDDIMVSRKEIPLPIGAGRVPPSPISSFWLGQNYPNPFNPLTTWQYHLSESGLVKVKIYDVLGREITTLVDEPKGAGTYTVQWDGRDQHGKRTASGLYFYRLQVSSQSGNTVKFRQTRKMLLIR